MTKRKTTNAVVVALLFGVAALFLLTRRDSQTTAAKPPPPVTVVESTPSIPTAAAAAEVARAEPETTARKNESSAREIAATEPVAAKKVAAEPEAEHPATEPAAQQNEPEKAVVAPTPPPTPTGTLAARFQNEVGVTYRLVSVSCTLDGVSACGEGKGKSFWMFNKKLDAGAHKLQVVAVYEGEGGVFSYADGFKFTVRSGRNVMVEPDHASQVSVMVREAGGPTTPMDQRLRMAFAMK